MSGERYRGLSDVRRRNRRNIRSLLYRRAPVTRTELAEELGLTLPTVTTSVAGMLEEGLLVEQPAPSGGGRGRTFCGSTRPPGMPSGWSWGRMRRRWGFTT